MVAKRDNIRVRLYDMMEISELYRSSTLRQGKREAEREIAAFKNEKLAQMLEAEQIRLQVCQTWCTVESR